MRFRRKGSYVLLVGVDYHVNVTVGRLGSFSYAPGYYLYTGSALGDFDSRIKRHIRKTKKLHWHIDYLLEYAKILELWGVFSEDRLECLLAQAARNFPGASVPAIGFGSSDCRCLTHLIYVPERPGLETFQSLCGSRIIVEKLPMLDVW